MSPTPRVQTALVAVGQVLSSLLALALVATLARSLSAADLGIYLYFVAVATALEGLSDMGLRLRAVASLAGVPPGPGRNAQMNAFWQLKIVLSIATFGMIVASASLGLIRYADTLTAAMIALVAIMLPSSSPFVWDLRAAGHQWLEAALLLVYRLLLLAYAVVVGDELDPHLMLAGLLGCNVALQLLLLAAREATQPIALDFPVDARTSTRWSLLRSALPFGVSLFLAQFAPRLWVFWLASAGSPVDVGNFSVALTVVQTSLLVPVAAGAAYLPALSRLARAGSTDFSDVSVRLVEAMAIAGSAVAILMLLSAGGVVPAVFGASLTATSSLVAVLAVLTPLLYMSFIARIILTSLDAGRWDLRATLVGMLFGAVLAGLLTWSGASGLTVVLAGYIASEIVGWLARMRAMRPRLAAVAPFLPTIIRPTLIAIILGGGLYVLASAHARTLAGGIGLAATGLLLFALALAAVPSIRRRGLAGLLP